MGRRPSGSGSCQNSGPRISFSNSYMHLRKLAVTGHGRVKIRISLTSLWVL